MLEISLKRHRESNLNSVVIDGDQEISLPPHKIAPGRLPPKIFPPGLGLDVGLSLGSGTIFRGAIRMIVH